MSSRFILVLVLVYAIAVWSQRSGGGGGRPAGGSGGTRLDPLSSSIPPSALVPTTSIRAEQEGKVTFKSQTILIQVPVVVTDKTGAHVHGLKKDDFKLLEEGKEQKVTVFDEFFASGTRITPSAHDANTFDNMSPDSQTPRSVTMIVLDGLNTPFLDQAYGRKQLIKYLSENIAPGQVIGLVAIGSKGLNVLSPPTTDSAILIAALKRVSGEIPAMQGITTDEQALAALAPNYTPAGNILGTNTAGLLGPGSLADFQNASQELTGFISSDDAAIVSYEQARAIDTTMRSFLNIAQLLSGIPGRKSLIWVTGGFPFYMDAASAVPGGNLSLLYERAMALMNDAQIAVYPVDARGLVNYLPVADASLRPTSAAQSSIVHGAGLNSIAVARSWLQVSTISTLQDFASMTGGRAFYNRNDLTTGFKRAADDSSSYYLLGFYLDSQNNKAGWRKLQVKVGRKDVEVRSRNGFFVTNATVDPAATHQFDISNALTSPLDSTGLPVSITWQNTVAEGDKKKIAFSLKVPNVGIVNESDQNHFDLDFAIQASQGSIAGKALGQVVKGAIPPEKLAEIKAQGIVYRNSLELEPGKYDVKFVVRDNQTGRVGSVTAPLTVN